MGLPFQIDRGMLRGDLAHEGRLSRTMNQGGNMVSRVIGAFVLLAGVLLIVGGTGEWITYGEGTEFKATMGLQDMTACDMKCKDGVCEEDGDKACESKTYEEAVKLLDAQIAAMPAGGALAVGTRVSCDWESGGVQYPGQITKIEGKKIVVTYDQDGSTEDTTIDKCTYEDGGKLGQRRLRPKKSNSPSKKKRWT